MQEKPEIQPPLYFIFLCMCCFRMAKRKKVQKVTQLFSKSHRVFPDSLLLENKHNVVLEARMYSIVLVRKEQFSQTTASFATCRKLGKSMCGEGLCFRIALQTPCVLSRHCACGVCPAFETLVETLPPKVGKLSSSRKIAMGCCFWWPMF